MIATALLQDFIVKHLPVSFLRSRWGNTASKSNSFSSADRQLLIDVSVISRSDAGTGIQRVVRNLYEHLLDGPPPGYRVHPIAATRKQGYHYLAPNFSQQASEKLSPSPAVPVQIHAGDLFLGLDLAANIVPHHLGCLLQWKRQGVRMYFFVYDLLPVLEPSWFNPKTTKNFRRWLRSLAILADNVITLSHAVQIDFKAWLRNTYRLDNELIPCATIRPGAELIVANISPNQSVSLIQWSPPHWVSHKFILMVGTIEPRKGHADALDAFEQLWAEGDQTHLVIAGKQGWKVESLMQRLLHHAELGHRLHWLDGPDDNTLISLYKYCSGLLMASKGEGFGLPLIEAIYFNKPVLARDLPVFKEIAGDGVSYFSSTGCGALKYTLPRWLNQLKSLNDRPNLPNSTTWKESCALAIRALFP